MDTCGYLYGSDLSSLSNIGTYIRFDSDDICSVPFCQLAFSSFLFLLQAHFFVSLLHVHFSASIYAALLSVVECLQLSSSNSRQVQKPNSLSSSMTSSYPTMPICFSISANFELFKFEISLDDDRDNISVLLLSLQQLKLM